MPIRSCLELACGLRAIYKQINGSSLNSHCVSSFPPPLHPSTRRPHSHKIVRLGFDTPPAAAMSGLGPLRRWKRFFSAFGHIDAAIEAAHPSISRDEFRSLRGRIVEMLCDAEDDDERAQQLCLALDGAMAESLVTLLEVPVSSRALASGDLAKSVSILGQHESARIRSLTRDVVRGWRSAVESEMDSARAAMEVLNNLSPLMPPEKERLAFVVNTNVPVAAGKDETQIKYTPAKFPSKSTPVTTGKDEKQIKDTPTKFPSKTTPVTTGKDETQIKDTAAKFPSKRTPIAGRSCNESDKMLATKRKLREGYQEAENAKSQRKIRVIEDPKMLEQPKQKKMHPITSRESSRARCGSLTTVRRSLMPSFIV
jgi:hypothetical protein